MGSYMRSLGNTAVLGRAQEARLAAIMQKGRQLELAAAQLAAARGITAGADASAAAAAVPFVCGGEDSSDAAAAAAAAVGDAELAAAVGLSPGEVAQRRVNQKEAKDLLMQYNVRCGTAAAVQLHVQRYSCNTAPPACLHACLLGSCCVVLLRRGGPSLPATQPTRLRVFPPTPHRAGWW